MGEEGLIIANSPSSIPDPLSLIVSRLPKKPYCSDNLSFGVKIRSHKTALGKAYIQLSYPWLRQLIAIDMDFRESGAKWIDDHLPPPNVVVINPDNEHSHYLYVLKYPVSIKNQKSWKYLVNVSSALTVGLEGDPNYVGMIQKNPFSKVWTTRVVRREGYELEELWEEVERYGAKEVRRVELKGESRNCDLFDELRVWAYSEKRKWGGSQQEWEERVEEKARELNSFEIPLPEGEVRGVAKSVSKWVWNRYTGVREGESRPLGKLHRNQTKSKERGEKLGEEEAKQRMAEGAKYTHRIQADRTRERIITAIGELVAKGEWVTQSAVVRKTGLSRETVKRYPELFLEY